MSAEFWAVIAVGAVLAGLQWRMYASLNGRLAVSKGARASTDCKGKVGLTGGLLVYRSYDRQFAMDASAARHHGRTPDGH